MNMHTEQLHRREFLKQATRATAALGLTGAMSPLMARADEAARPHGSRISYYGNGEIHVGLPGQREGKPLTTGHRDFKPSWSKTGDTLVFFRRLKNDPEVGKWSTAACIINVDGTGFHQLSNGTVTDFNPTWTREGKNTPLWNRKNPATGGYCIMASKVGGKPGEEVALTDRPPHPRCTAICCSCSTTTRKNRSSSRSTNAPARKSAAWTARRRATGPRRSSGRTTCAPRS